MAIEIYEIESRFSGTANNVDPNASLGGAMSTHVDGKVTSQTIAQPVDINVTPDAVTILQGFGNSVGVADLKWDKSNNQLQWMTSAAVSYAYATIDTGTGVTPTTYTIGNANGYIIVEVIYDNLPLVTTQEASGIAVANTINNVFDAVSAIQATDGLVEYRCLYIFNATAGVDTANDVRVWIKQQPVGPDELDIAVQSPLYIGDCTTSPATGVAIGPLVDEEDSTDLLVGLTWVRPSSQANGLGQVALAPGEGFAFWERREVFAGTVTQVPEDTSRIGISALI